MPSKPRLDTHRRPPSSLSGVDRSSPDVDRSSNCVCQRGRRRDEEPYDGRSRTGRHAPRRTLLVPLDAAFHRACSKAFRFACKPRSNDRPKRRPWRSHGIGPFPARSAPPARITQTISLMHCTVELSFRKGVNASHTFCGRHARLHAKGENQDRCWCGSGACHCGMACHHRAGAAVVGIINAAGGDHGTLFYFR